MYTLGTIVRGTLQFIWKDAGPSVLDLLLTTYARPWIRPLIPTGRRIGRELWNRLRDGPRNNHKTTLISIRKGHVPSEDSFVDLPDTDTPFETEYSVQLHNADKAGRHFDFRIKVGDKAVSWAIPMKGQRAKILRFPKSGERWIAIRQPDHTVPYMKWEGEIQEGKGKGDVKLYASGTCDILKIEDGHVHVRTYGQLKGDFVLVSTSDGRGLIVAKTIEPGIEWERPSYTKKPLDILDVLNEKNRVAENKVDGASAELVVTDYGTRVFSHRVSKRTGELIEYSDKIPHIRDVRAPEESGTRLRGEVYHRNGVEFLSGLLNSNVERARLIQRTLGPAKIAVFDITTHRGVDIRDLPYETRRILYEHVVRRLGQHIHPVEQVHGRSFSKFFERVIQSRDIPSDGVVIKDLNTAFFEKPHIKVKPRDSLDCEVVGVTPGTNKYAQSLGALTVLTPDGVEVQVGTGFKDWQRDWIWHHRDEIIGDTAKVQFHVRGGRLTKTGPAFGGWHPDKSEAALGMYTDSIGLDRNPSKEAA